LVPFVVPNALPQALVVVGAVEAVDAVFAVLGNGVHEVGRHVPVGGLAVGASFVQETFAVPTGFAVLSEDSDTSKSPAATLRRHVALHRQRLAVGALDFVRATRRIGMQGLDLPAALADGTDSLNSAGIQRIQRDNLLSVRLEGALSFGSRGYPQLLKLIEFLLSDVSR